MRHELRGGGVLGSLIVRERIELNELGFVDCQRTQLMNKS